MHARRSIVTCAIMLLLGAATSSAAAASPETLHLQSGRTALKTMDSIELETNCCVCVRIMWPPMGGFDSTSLPRSRSDSGSKQQDFSFWLRSVPVDSPLPCTR